MESYGLSFKSDLIIEKIWTLPIWNKTDEGRIIYEVSTKRSYIGRILGWELIGIYDKMIGESHLFLDTLITGSKQSISALKVPIQLSNESKKFLTIDNSYSQDTEFFSYDSTSNVQFVIDEIYNHLFYSNFVFNKSIIDKKILKNMINDSDIVCNNDTISDRLISILTIPTRHIPLNINYVDDEPDLGYLFGFGITNLYSGLNLITNGIFNIDALNIDADITYLSEKSKIQFIYDDIYYKHSVVKFDELLDSPEIYENDKISIIKTNGLNSLVWDNPSSNNIAIRFPNIFKTINTKLTNTISVSNYFYPRLGCSITNIVNIIDFKSQYHSPSDFFSTSIQIGLEMVREMQCSEPPRSVSCDSILIVNSDSTFLNSKTLEQLKGSSSRFIYDIRNLYIYEWSTSTTSWILQQCPDWTVLEKNMLYFNDLTNKLYYYNCDNNWLVLI